MRTCGLFSRFVRSHPPLHSVCQEYFPIGFQLVNSALGFALNVLLLHVICRISPKELGTYKFLLGLFAAYDTFLVCVDYICNMVSALFHPPARELAQWREPFWALVRMRTLRTESQLLFQIHPKATITILHLHIFRRSSNRVRASQLFRIARMAYL